MRKKAFTLIELLVVIAIIAILAAILFPVFARAKEAAKKTAGLAQMKQLATAVMMYATDYDDGIPTWNECLGQLYRDGFYEAGKCDDPGVLPDGRYAPGRFWDTKLSPYVKNGRPEEDDHSGLWQSPGREYKPGRSIGMNQLAMWDPSRWSAGNCGASTSRWSGCYFWLQLGEVEEPVNTMFTADSGTSGRYEPMYFLNGYRDAWMPESSYYHEYVWGQAWRYGQDGANYTWLDGHAKFHKGDQIYTNPDHLPSLSWPVENTVAIMCNTLKYQASTMRMNGWLEEYIFNIWGATCPG